MSKAGIFVVAGFVILAVAVAILAAGLAAAPRAPLFVAGFALVGLLGTAFWAWMIVDVAVNEPDQGNTKIVWLLVVLLGQLIGALIYFFVRRPQRMLGGRS